MKHHKQCVICGKSFPSPPSSKTVARSDPCRIERARRARTGKTTEWSEESKKKLSVRGVTGNLLKGTPAAKESPNSGPYETNVNALE